MNPETLEALYGKIARLTEDGLIRWRPQDDGSFIAHFPRSSIGLEPRDGTEQDEYQLSIYNQDGVVVAHVSRGEDLGFPERAVAFLRRDVEPLYHRVAAQVYKSDDTARDLFEELAKLEKQVGSPSP